MLETADRSHEVLIETGAVEVMINILSLKYINLHQRNASHKIGYTVY